MATERTTRTYGGQSMVAPLQRVLIFPPVEPSMAATWEEFGYHRPIDHDRAVQEHAGFRQLLVESDIEVIEGNLYFQTLQDGIFPYDTCLTTDAGMILCSMGKRLREQEIERTEGVLKELGIPIIGRITQPGTLEGGDCCWLDERTLAVGQGYRTNAEGIRQLTALLAPLGVNVITVHLPHWNGPGECLHLLSLISPVDERLAVVYRPLLAVPFLEELRARKYDLIDVPDSEFESQGCNILAVAPRRCIILQDNAQTRQLLLDAGCQVATYTGYEISHNRGGGPTCLTRPLLRSS